jgi:hypothetical protein
MAASEENVQGPYRGGEGANGSKGRIRLGRGARTTGKGGEHGKQGCLNGRPTVKFTVRTSARVCVYPADAILPADGFLPSADAGPRGPTPTGTGRERADGDVRRESARTRVHADTWPHPYGHEFRGGRFFRISYIKGGALPLFPHFQPIPVE